MPIPNVTNGTAAHNPELPPTPVNTASNLTAKRVAIAIFLAAASYAVVRYTLSKYDLNISPIVQTTGEAGVSAILSTAFLWLTPQESKPNNKSSKPEGNSNNNRASDNLASDASIALKEGNLNKIARAQLTNDSEASILRSARAMIEKLGEAPSQEEITAAISRLNKYTKTKNSIEYLLLSCWLEAIQFHHDFFSITVNWVDALSSDDAQGKDFTKLRDKLGKTKSKDATPRMIKSMRKTLRKINQNSDNNLIETIRLTTWIDQLERQYHFYAYAIPASYVDREIKEIDNGDCAFLTLARKTALAGSPEVNEEEHAAAAQTLRKEAIEWIRNNFGIDSGLTTRLSQSLFEHYTAKADRISGDISVRAGTLIPEQLAKLEKAITPESQATILAVYEDLHRQVEEGKEEEKRLRTLACSAFDQSQIEGMLDDYLNEMIQPGTFAGAAELYAIGKLYNLLIHVYRPEGEANPRAVEVNLPVIEASDFTEFQNYEHFHMIRRGAHYNSYYPIEEGDGAGVGQP